jgi:hypothetical protein
VLHEPDSHSPPGVRSCRDPASIVEDGEAQWGDAEADRLWLGEAEADRL